jgi:TP901 family phage tail tape measure protein
MANHSLVIQVGANVQGLVNGMRTATTATQNWANSTLDAVEQNEAAINGLSNKLGALGLAGVAAAGLAVKKFADFDQAMSNVAATGEEAALWMGELRDAALEAGAKTVYSATEAAGAIEELSKAGVSATDILGGGLDGALDLAAAGALSVADAASYTSVALNQFKLSGDKAAHVADLLAAGAGKAMGDVSDLGQALKQGGLVAAQTGLSIEETTGALASFAQAGLLGADAGTSLKSMLQRLTPQSAEAQKQFDDLGISAYDAQGNFVGLENFAGQLKDKMKDLSPEARNAAMAVMFGSDAVRAASVLYDQGAEGINTWIDAVDDQGYAAEVAATRLDNLKGDLEGLSGAFDTWMINLGEGANGPLRALVQNATNVVNAFGDLPSGVQTATLSIVGGGGLVALGLAGMGKVLIMVKDVRNAMVAMSITAKKAAVGVGAIGGLLGVATVALINWGNASSDAKEKTDSYLDSLDELGNRTDATVVKISEALTKDRRNWLDSHWGNPRTLIDNAKAFGLTAEDMTGYILGTGEAVEKVQSKIEDYRDALPSGIERLGVEDFSQGFMKALDGEAKGLTNAEKKKLQQIELNKKMGVSEAEAAGEVDATRSALARLADAQATGTANTEGYTNALKELVDAQRAASGAVLSERDARRQYEQTLADATAALKEHGRNLDITTEAGRKNQDALDGIVASGEDLIESMRANGASQEQLQKAVKKTRDDFIKQAEKMGLSKDAAKALADEMELFPDSIKVEVAIETSKAKAALDELIRKAGSLGNAMVVAAGGTPRSAPGVSLPHNAGGGPISGPGTGTSDSVLSWLSDGEYVIKASSVRKYGPRMLGMLNEGTLPGFASGGLVKGHSLAYWEERRASSLELVRMQQQVRDLSASLRETEKTKSGRKRFVLRGLDRREAELELRAARQELADARTANEINRSKSGTIKSRMARAEKKKDRAERDADKRQEAAEAAAEHKESISSGLRGGFSLGGLFGQKDAFGYDKPVTKQSMLAAAKGYANKLKVFAGKLAKAGKLLGPKSGVILEEIVGLGVEEGTTALDAILTMTAAEAASFVASYAGIATNADRAAGNSVPPKLETAKGMALDYGALAAAMTHLQVVGQLGIGDRDAARLVQRGTRTIGNLK